MFSKKSIFYSMVFVTFFGFFVAKVAAEEDDDDLVGEILADLMIGVGIAICEEFVICKSIILVAGFIGFIVFIIGVCVGDVNCSDICNGRNARRGFTVGAGYGVGRAFRGRV